MRQGRARTKVLDSEAPLEADQEDHLVRRIADLRVDTLTDEAHRLLAKAGVKCVVFERELFPRPHVGESLVPSSTRVFKDLDFLGQMEEAKFPHKFGAVWTTNDENPGYVHDLEGLTPEYNVDIRFDERKQEGMEDRNYTYHVDRGKFDLMLLQHAQKLGATVYDGVKVARVDFGPEHPDVYFNIGPKEMHVSCKMVVHPSICPTERSTRSGSSPAIAIDPVQA